jgi:hypothetical protein
MTKGEIQRSTVKFESYKAELQRRAKKKKDEEQALEDERIRLKILEDERIRIN